MCNCKGTELVAGIVILVLALWPTIFTAVVSKWIIVVAAVVLIIHALGCKDIACCGTDAGMEKPKAKKKAKKK